jgi:hypothetical protein
MTTKVFFVSDAHGDCEISTDKEEVEMMQQLQPSAIYEVNIPANATVEQVKGLCVVAWKNRLNSQMASTGI